MADEQNSSSSAATAQHHLLKQRSRSPSRFYHLCVIVLLSVAILIAIVSLGAFGVKHADVKKFSERVNPATDNVCILFSKYHYNGVIFSKDRSCVFVLWGQASIVLFFVGWLIYCVVLTVLGPKIVSLFRIPDLVLAVLGLGISAATSICISAGLNSTCDTLISNRKPGESASCHRASIHNPYDESDKVYFYGNIHAAETTSWILTVKCAILLLWNAALCIKFCMNYRDKRKQQGYQEIPTSV